ncbi:ENL/AF9-related superfamily elongation complex transcription factor [Arctopsyche grandis]|uniref:ENL/AF9-related superfamily elongation complex transcription factor n=1 Tax=Arctopsyche grandis TaxID=121162 RepID=UPI00406D9901
MAVRVFLEVGHEASIRTKRTPEGFTHDWEVFVRGADATDIQHFVDKVVFQLHDTFPKPKRTVKEPPYSVKESGYAGFNLPIEIHLKNRDEPKKIKVNYDLDLQPSGPPIKKVRNEQHVFPNPSDEFKRKLLKAGGTILSSANSVHSNIEHERNSRDSITEEKSQQLIGKPKLGGDNIKKHKPKDYDLSRQPNNLKNLFGPNIHKLPTISPDPKKPSPTSKADKREKPYIEKQKPKEIEHREEKKVAKDEKTKEEKRKSHKERDPSKDKSSKRPVEKPPSPIPLAKRPAVHPLSPRRVSSPSNKSNSSASSKEEVKSVKQSNSADPKIKPQKMPDISLSKVEKKGKKEKKSHDKEREILKKEHKKEKDPKPVVIPEIRENKPKEIPKEIVTKDISNKEKEKPPTKPEKPINKFSIENMLKDPQDAQKYSDGSKHKGKSEREKKHKHKKKDKKRDESREKIKDQFPKEKKHKSDKKSLSENKETINIEKLEPVSVAKDPEKIITISKPFKEKDRSLLTISPISIDTSSQSSSKSLISKSSKSGKNPLTSMMEALSSSSGSDSDNSIISDDEDTLIESAKVLKVTSKLPEPTKSEPVKLPTPEVAKIDKQPVEKIDKVNQFQPVHRAQKMKEKTSKQEMKEEKKQRKRKSGSKGEDETTGKMSKSVDEVDQASKKRSDNASNPLESFQRTKSDSSRSKTDTKVQDDGVSSSLSDNPLKCDSPINEDSHMVEAHEISPDYMIQLKELQKRIMTLQSNEELERVVNLIAETGKYEVTKKTFDFDLCLLDRTTVQQLQEMIGCESRA